MNKSIVFPKKGTDSQNYYYFNPGFSNEELEKIYNGVSTLPFNNAIIGDNNIEDLQVRSSSIKWIPCSDDWSWLYEKMMNLIIEANNSLWHFDLDYLIDNIQYTEYYAEKGGHYTWHQDIGPTEMSKRKISITVQLSDTNEYEGGDLEYFKGGNPDFADKAPRGKGVVFIFPSYMMHRVTKVTKGTRRSFVLWVGGDHYK
jgi:PKHD-type hydroxylase